MIFPNGEKIKISKLKYYSSRETNNTPKEIIYYAL